MIFSVLHNRHLSDIWVICQKCKFEVRKGCKGLFLQSKAQDMHCKQAVHCKQADTAILFCQMHGFVAQPGVLGIMCLFYWPGFNATNTRFSRETDNDANTRFLGLIWTQTLLRQTRFDSDFAQTNNCPFKPLLWDLPENVTAVHTVVHTVVHRLQRPLQI